jgi:hypothetical protein
MGNFNQPSTPGDGITWEDHLGALLVIDVLGVEDGIRTSFGEKTAVRAHVNVIDGQGKDDTYPDTLIFPTLLVSQTKTQVGAKILGRLGQGNAKPGQKPPWLLLAADDDDNRLAEAWLKAQVSPVFATADNPPF